MRYRSLLLLVFFAACSSTLSGGDGGNCPTGQTPCGALGACVDLASDTNNCGACGNACLPGQSCLESACSSAITPECTPGQAFCADAGLCADLAADPNNCGACGASCAPGQTCLARVCTGAVVDAGNDAGSDAGADAGLVCGAECLACESCSASVCAAGPLYGASPFLFTAATTLLVAGDFNGDGLPDLMSNDGFGNSTIAYGLPDGGFALSTHGGNGYVPAMVGADFFGDGKTTVAYETLASESGPLSATVSAGDWQGMFAAGTGPTAGSLLGEIGAGDLDGDGRPDLVFDINGVSGLALNDGDGGFIAQDGLQLAAVGAVQTVLPPIVVLDLNQDGMADLAFADPNSGTLQVAYQTRRGNGLAFAVPQSISEYPPASLVSAPLDADGGLMLVASFENQTVRGYRGSPNGAVPAFELSPFPVDSTVTGLAAADFNGDGWIDLAGLSEDSSLLVWLNAGPDAGFRPAAATRPLVDCYSLYSPALVAMVGDAGLPLLAAISFGRNAIFSPTCAR